MTRHRRGSSSPNIVWSALVCYPRWKSLHASYGRNARIARRSSVERKKSRLRSPRRRASSGWATCRFVSPFLLLYIACFSEEKKIIVASCQLYVRSEQRYTNHMHMPNLTSSIERSCDIKGRSTGYHDDEICTRFGTIILEIIKIRLSCELYLDLLGIPQPKPTSF